jgi:hypothetical protein
VGVPCCRVRCATAALCVLPLVFFGLWGRGRLEYLVWVPVGPPSGVGGGVVAGCREAVVSGAVYVVKLVTARGAEASVVFTAN